VQEFLLTGSIQPAVGGKSRKTHFVLQHCVPQNAVKIQFGTTFEHVFGNLQVQMQPLWQFSAPENQDTFLFWSLFGLKRKLSETTL
jgi:hypothetical protein